MAATPNQKTKPRENDDPAANRRHRGSNSPGLTSTELLLGPAPGSSNLGEIGYINPQLFQGKNSFGTYALRGNKYRPTTPERWVSPHNNSRKPAHGTKRRRPKNETKEIPNSTSLQKAPKHPNIRRATGGRRRTTRRAH